MPPVPSHIRRLARQVAHGQNAVPTAVVVDGVTYDRTPSGRALKALAPQRAFTTEQGEVTVTTVRQVARFSAPDLAHLPRPLAKDDLVAWGDEAWRVDYLLDPVGGLVEAVLARPRRGRD